MANADQAIRRARDVLDRLASRGNSG
jgi:hypothetical protein